MLFDVYEGMKEFVYECVQGECLEEIAERFLMPVNKLVELNGLTAVCCGDKLIIKRGEGRLYRVAAGETMESIASVSCTAVERIKEVNGITCVYPGLVLIV